MRKLGDQDRDRVLKTYWNLSGSEFQLLMEKLKEILHGMVEKKIIYNGGRGELESYYVTNSVKNNNVNNVSSENSTDEHNNTSNISTPMAGVNMEHASFCEKDSCKTFCNKSPKNLSGNLESFIDEKFHETLISLIKTHVKQEFILLTKNKLLSPMITKSNELSANDVVISNDMDANVNKIMESKNLVDSLKSEVEFLRNEDASKDKIIELLITEKSHYNDENKVNYINEVKTNRPLFIPKIYSRVDNVSNNIPVSIFNALADKSMQVNTEENVSTDPTMINKKKKYRSTTIIGDSIIRDIKQHKMRKALPGNKIFIKSFSGATTDCLEHYIQPSLRYKPDLLIIHRGSNDLRSGKSPHVIAENIMKLASGAKTEENDVIIRGIVKRNDDLNPKGMQVNSILKLLCAERKIGFLDNSCIDPSKHLNKSNLHLNYNGTVALANNFLKEIKL